ncbi:hypothetical protein J7T55_005562 [Diaporthe amygdali]|uniref:uncharacterized protein n=1 Tax=Phomopsis amygdali TaxID=1214568 RepID=UPI0022FEED4D|nr:uncharacterized protein J7T55_005562 [Diaporthe amygdali]KAJ0109013.1 hypothetical protein J7T55_005562 [Diaporthe amygdali]
MEPISAIGLIASALSVAEIAAVVGRGCRHLQTEFNGALEHVDNISQQTSNIDLAIREICSIVDQRPQTFPSTFEGHLDDSISAIHNIVKQIQDHVHSVKTEAETSQSRAKLRHLRKSNQITEWRTTLGVQIQALMLLLQVAQLHSNDERKTVLENASSKKLFEKASSMSAKLTKSCRELDRKEEFTKFPFDPILLESKVYRRVCESSWIREVSTSLQDGNESNSDGPDSAMSVSSNSAIASEGDCASSSASFDLPGNEPRIPECPNSTDFSPDPPTLELSATNSSEQTGESSRTNPTRSTMATTVSVFDELPNTGIDTEKDDEDHHLDKSSMISVVVEGVGTESIRLVIDEASDHYEKIQEAILRIRDRVLLAGGIEPGTYCGVCVSKTIETSGQSDVHRFPLTPEFLAYATNKVVDGFYEGFGILFAGWDNKQSFAVKRLHSHSRTKFSKEIEILKAFARAGHPHLIRLLTTYTWRGHDHLLFPWAEGNLQDFWRYCPDPAAIKEPKAGLDLTRRTLEQCLGLADALKHLHLLLKLQNRIEVEDTCDTINYGRHGDIKPQNILWFHHKDDNEDKSILKIADFGLAKFHSSSVDQNGRETRGGTETYAAPELKHHPPEHRLSSAYDIWSLGCVLMEFACWITGGRDRLGDFKESRPGSTSVEGIGSIL